MSAFSRLRRGLLIAPGARWWEVWLDVVEKYGASVLPNFLVRRFQRALEYSHVQFRTYWMGTPCVKKPQDCWIYQEIIWETRPQVLIETGSFKGGSALFFGSVFDLMGQGSVITIDVDDCASRTLSHPRITPVVGSSVSAEVLTEVRRMVGNQTAMVSLDSDHSKEHVLREMELYSEFVTPGNYMVVEDTGIRGPGPNKAVEEFLRHRDDFVRDRAREKFMVTSCRGGFLRKV
jgi:cephalosporin hydroxylase